MDKAPLKAFRKRLTRAQILELIDEFCEDRPKLIKAMDDDGRKSWSVREILENYARIYKEYGLLYWNSPRWRLVEALNCKAYPESVLQRRANELMGPWPGDSTC